MIRISPMTLAYILQMTGVAVFACSGALSAGRKSLDVVGVIVISFSTAVGGGTLRDLLLQRNIFWLADPVYLWVCIGAGALTWLYASFWPLPQRTLLFADACGLGLFAISGAQIAEQFGHSVVISCIMGVITGVAGGVLRDVLCGEIPLIFRKSELYASAAMLGTIVYFSLKALSISTAIASLVGIGVITLLRCAALIFGWHLPVFHFREQSGKSPGGY
ncbi:MAG: trimeric intracellular cation channel family protein [Chthoniobacterales bacterium]